MLKSEIYRLAQFAVVNSPSIAPESKIEVLRVLMMEEDLEKFSEEREAQKELNDLLNNEAAVEE